jgi:hypothetical protein
VAGKTDIPANKVSRKLKETVSDGLINAKKQFTWENDVNALHLNVDDNCKEMIIKITRQPQNTFSETIIGNQYGLSRIQLSKQHIDEQSVEIEFYSQTDDELHLKPLLDRAHYPV